MTVISDDPSLWPLINFYRVISYSVVVASTVVAYNWALTFGQEFELVWRQRWSPITGLYLSLRLSGIVFCAINILSTVPSISITDAGCAILAFAQTWTSFVVWIILGVIIITRLYAMYQQSRKILIFLVVIFLAVTIACGVINGIKGIGVSYEEFVLSGTYQCTSEGSESSNGLLMAVPWVLYIAWGILGLSFTVWMSFEHFREMKRWNSEDRVTALIKTHVIYFAAFTAAACLNLGFLSPEISNLSSVGLDIYFGTLEIVLFVQMFVLGPSLILHVREYNAKLSVNSDAGRTGIQLFSRTALTTRQVTVVCGTGDERQVPSTL